jgi:hypothetical protein
MVGHIYITWYVMMVDLEHWYILAHHRLIGLGSSSSSLNPF